MQKQNPKWWKHVDRAINVSFLIYLAYVFISEWQSFVPPVGASKFWAFSQTIGHSLFWFVLVLIAFGATVSALVFAFLRNDKSSHPTWLRGLRVLGFISSAMAILIFMAVLKK